MGLATRYDGRSKGSIRCQKIIRDRGCLWVPVCPEQLGGLSTPRVAAAITGDNGAEVHKGTAKVITKEGRDVSDNFLRGAHMVLDIAQKLGASTVFLKAKSPSCGVSSPLGVTAALLREHGLKLQEF